MQEASSVRLDTGYDSLWTYVACPTLVVDQAGVIRALSASAQELIPSAAPGSPLEATVDWLSPVHRRLVAPRVAPSSRESFSAAGPVGGRKFEAHYAKLPRDEVAWSLVEDTGHVLREAQHALITTAPRSASLRITGDLDFETIDDLVEVATQVLEQNELGDLHLDFSETEFLDSAALSGLLLLHRRTAQAGIALHLDNRPAFLDRVLQVTGLFDHFDLTRTDAETGDADLLGQATSGQSIAR